MQMKIKGSKVTIKKVFGINIDLREKDPAFAEMMDRLATDHGVEPIADEGIFAIVVVGASGKHYDATVLGEASVAEARAMIDGDGD